MRSSHFSCSRRRGGILASRVLRIGLLVALIAACAPVQIRPPADPMLVMVTGERIPVSVFEARTEESMRKAGVTGLAVAIINDRRLAHATQFGWRDKDAGTRVDDSTVFAGGSLAKPVVAYLALLLTRHGVLDLDRPLHEYLREPLPRYSGYSKIARDDRYRSITARMVLSHTSGLANLREAGDWTCACSVGSGKSFQLLRRGISASPARAGSDYAEGSRSNRERASFRPIGHAPDELHLARRPGGANGRPSQRIRVGG